MRESGPEQARFGEGEVDVALSGGAQAPERPNGLRPSAGHCVQPCDHSVGQSRLGILFHRSKECVAIGVVPVRRGVADPGHPLNVAQHHCLRPACPGEFDGVLEQRLPQISMVVGVGGGAGSSGGQSISFLSHLDVYKVNIGSGRLAHRLARRPPVD